MGFSPLPPQTRRPYKASSPTGFGSCWPTGLLHSSASPYNVQGFERAKLKQPTENSHIGGVSVEAVRAESWEGFLRGCPSCTP